MAMEKLYVVRDTHTRPITALGFHTARREILTGCEDGMVKMYEAETGKLSHSVHEHGGWVTDFLYWPKPKMTLSSSNDGFIVCWGSGGEPVDKITVGAPVYCLAINPRRRQLLCGMHSVIKVFNLDFDRKSHHYINNKCVFSVMEHTDIVQCVLCHESRVYSAGYDHRLVIYDSSYMAKDTMTTICKNNNAHEAGICCLQLAKDEINTWILTGSFDKTVKIWTTDGKLAHPPQTNFASTVTGVCFVKHNKTIWAVGGTSYACLYDPKSGDNVSDFIGTFQNETDGDLPRLHLLKYFPDQNQVVASTSRRQLVVWKYNSFGCISALKCDAAVQSIAYTKKLPLLIFSGDADGIITKWERIESNYFKYSKEMFPLSDTKKARQRTRRWEEDEAKHEWLLQYQRSKRPIVTSRYAYLNRSSLPPISSHNHRNTGILKVAFSEELDLIVGACEDGNIYIWGFDLEHVQVLKDMLPCDSEQLIHRYAVLMNAKTSPTEETKTEADSVSNRVAGYICKHILSEHKSYVTSLAIVKREHGYDTTFLVSGGWDRRICIWDLETGSLHDVFTNQAHTDNHPDVEMACDGIITDMVFCPLRTVLAYSTSDRLVYIRKFSPIGAEMVLLNTLQGHYAEVNCLARNPTTQSWVTGSEDCTLRVWADAGLNECVHVLTTQRTVTAVAVDSENGAIIAAIHDQIRVFEPELYTLVQTHVGHTDAILSILHIPERKQYLTAGADGTIRVWNAWTKKVARRNQARNVPQPKSNDTERDAPSTEADEDEL